MYTEFIIIFCGLGVTIVLLLVVIVLLIVLLKKTSNEIPMSSFTMPVNTAAGQFQPTAQPASNAFPANNSVVYCRNCFTEFDATAQFCPKCGTPRS